MKLPKTVLVNENETAEEKAERILKEYEILQKDFQALEKKYGRLRKYLARLRERTASMAGYRRYRIFMAIMDGMAFHGEFSPETLAQKGGKSRVDLLISHAANLALQAYVTYSKVTHEKYIEMTMSDAVVSPKTMYDATQYEDNNK
jgi:hypothetical protein